MYTLVMIISDPCLFALKHNLCMVHSACKLCYHVYTRDLNLRPMFFPYHALKHNLWMVTRIHSASKLCYHVHTRDHNLRPMFFPNHALKHNLWMVTRIHSACKLCYHVHTRDHNLRPMFFSKSCIEIQLVDGDSDSLSV